MSANMFFFFPYFILKSYLNRALDQIGFIFLMGRNKCRIFSRFLALNYKVGCSPI